MERGEKEGAERERGNRSYAGGGAGVEVVHAWKDCVTTAVAHELTRRLPPPRARRILAGLGSAPGTSSITPTYGPCEAEALKKRMMRAVASLGEAEVRDIMATEGKIEVCCEFCNEKYQFQEEEVLAYINN